jgi:hypothetical protein
MMHHLGLRPPWGSRGRPLIPASNMIMINGMLSHASTKIMTPRAAYSEPNQFGLCTNGATKHFATPMLGSKIRSHISPMATGVSISGTSKIV